MYKKKDKMQFTSVVWKNRRYIIICVCLNVSAWKMTWKDIPLTKPLVTLKKGVLKKRGERELTFKKKRKEKTELHLLREKKAEIMQKVKKLLEKTTS